MISKSILVAIVAICGIVSAVDTQAPLPHKVIEFMGSRHMRYHHFLWHNLRENWLNLDAATQHAISKLGWAPPRPSMAYLADGSTVVLKDNGSGEDFLYMHRQMLIMTNKMVADTDYKKVIGLKNCPYPGDPDYPVPPTYDTGDAAFNALLTKVKSEAFFWSDIQPTDDKLWDHEYLKTISLGRLGSEVEYSVHQWMHLRFSDKGKVGLRNTNTANPTPNIDTKWDNLDYQWLADAYSSHVNPFFWKIHGWVDDHIEEWRKANGLATVPWQYTWENGPESTIEQLFAAGDVKDSDDSDDTNDSDLEPDEEMLTAMAKVVKIMLELGKDNHLKHNATATPGS